MAARELEPTTKRGVATRSRGKLLALAAATVVVLYLCFLLIAPFIPPIVWAVTAAVVTHRFSRWVGGHVKTPDAKAGICVAIVAVVVLLPAVLVIVVGAQQVAIAIAEWDSISEEQLGNWVKSSAAERHLAGVRSRGRGAGADRSLASGRCRGGVDAALSADADAADVVRPLFSLPR